MFSEINKNIKINESKENFFLIKNEIHQEIINCKKNNQTWIFGGFCKTYPSIHLIQKYFNKIKHIKNPYDFANGVNGTSGSTMIEMKLNEIVLSVDFNNDGGIDIRQTIDLN